MQKRTHISELSLKKGEEVIIEGWIQTRRDQGKMIFFDFRDASGFVQGVVLPSSDALEKSKDIREEFVVRVTGKVNERPDKNKQVDVTNGDIELEVIDIEILNTCKVLPFPIHEEDTRDVNEAMRLQYRYLDLRNKRMKKNVEYRAKTQLFLRNKLSDEGFLEIETPLLSAPTPEGSRSFVIPHRIVQGKYYSLPQSPQQYKQLLMVAGFEKYFQFARCMRDEDTRGDRQPEFTQLDMEMAFIEEEDVISINEKLLIALVEELYPEKTIQEVPFPRMTYKEAMEKYGTDRPDIRKDTSDPNLLAFLWIVDFPMFEKNTGEVVDEDGEWTFTHNPFSRPKEEHIDMFMKKENIGDIISTQYDVTLNGFEIGGGSIRAHKAKELRNTFEIMGYSKERIDKNFGHILNALEFGAPPHGGIAWGFDRLLMVLENEPNIREVIPFAKTGDGKDLMMDAPADISPAQKKELGL